MERIKAALEAFAVGDAMGMPTEYMTREEIRTYYGFVDHLVAPKAGSLHFGLPAGRITDDTEQVLYLLEEYLRDGRVSVEGTVRALIRWYDEAKPVEYGFIGPSSRKALERLKRGESPEVTGNEGITCGGAMRVVAAAFCTPRGNYDQLVRNVHSCLLPTHNTSVALEAAMAFAFAVHSALSGNAVEEVLQKALEGASIGRKMGVKVVAASTEARVKMLLQTIPSLGDKEDVLKALYDLVGTEMVANQVVPVVFGIVYYTWDDPWQAICMGASIGGDTDTIASMSGLLATLLCNGHNIPQSILEKVLQTNRLQLEKYVVNIVRLFQQNV